MKRHVLLGLLWLAALSTVGCGDDASGAGSGDAATSGDASLAPDAGRDAGSMGVMAVDANAAGGNDASIGEVPADASVDAGFDAGPQGPPQLLHGRAQHTASVIDGKYVYVIGGDAPGSLDSVERAKIGKDGTLGPFEDAGIKLLTPRYGHAAFVGGDTLYVMGGVNREAASSTGTTLMDVEEAPIMGDGTLGAFKLSSITLPSALSGLRAVPSGKHLYLLGTLQAEIDANGVPGNFKFDGFAKGFNSFGGAGLVISGDFAYAFEGAKAARAPVDADGLIGNFMDEAASELTGRRNGDFQTVVLAGKLYVIGGQPPAGSIYDTIEVAAINGDGSLGAFSVHTQKLSSPRFRHATVVIDDAIVVIGGSTGTCTSCYTNAVDIVTP